MPRTEVRKIQVKVRRDDVGYPVVVCRTAKTAELGSTFKKLGLLESRGQMGRLRRRACVLIDEGFARARPDVVRSIQRIYPEPLSLWIRIPGAEASKSFGAAERVLGEMIKAGFTRNDLCIAIGGGVIGDLGGFVASLFHRGMDIVHIPTTLLAMVDSSIGGKTAVNHPEGKNLIGTFHQPRAVVAVLDFLASLPDSDFQSGLGEVFKYAAGFSPKLFRYLQSNHGAVRARKPEALSRIVLESIKIKSAVVRDDERETGVARLKLASASKLGDRRLLNLGHTAGHGLEKAYALPHGVAVAIGVILAAKLSVRVKLCPERCYDQVMKLGTSLGLKAESDIHWRLEDILPYIKRDKKLVGDRLQYVCLKKVGYAVVCPVRFSDLKLLEN